MAYTAASTCSAGKCIAPTSISCDDGLECTTDSCDGTNGCGHVNVAWGTACTTGTSAQKYQFCAAALCTGVEEANTLLNATDNIGGLFGIDRYASTNISASGYEGTVTGGPGGNTTYSGRMATIAESPLGIGGNATGASSTAFYDQRSRLAVGGSITVLNDANPATMIINPNTGIWGGGGPSLTGFSRTLRAVDVFTAKSGDESYVFGGYSSANGSVGGITSTLAWSTYDGFTWTTPTRLVVSNSFAACAQTTFNVNDIYAAGNGQVYIAGQTPGSGVGTSGTTGIATWDGNATTTCGVTTGVGGVAYTDMNAYSTSFTSATSAAFGNLRAIHGTSATHMLAGGEGGTLIAYDGVKWTQVTPKPAITPAAWGANFQVRSIYLNGSDGWVAGAYLTSSGGVCSDWFVLHGTYTAGPSLNPTWTWDKVVLTNLDLHICNNNAVLNNGPWKIWVDPSTASVYLVGNTQTDITGTPSSQGTQTRPEVLRIKMK